MERVDFVKMGPKSNCFQDLLAFTLNLNSEFKIQQQALTHNDSKGKARGKTAKNRQMNDVVSFNNSSCFKEHLLLVLILYICPRFIGIILETYSS